MRRRGVNEPAYILGSLLLLSVLSASGALLIAFAGGNLDAWQRYLTPLAAGVIFGGALIHLVPHFAAEFGFSQRAGLLAGLGVAGSFVLEEAVHRRSQHREYEAYSATLVVGDGVHNVVDGVVVASSFYASLPVGVAATLSVGIHKIPKELGDFGALLQAGIDEWRAVGINVLTNLFGFAGAVAVIQFATVERVVAVLLPLAIGNFLYVAGADLLPAVRSGDAVTGTQLGALLVGIGAMYAITLVV